MKSSVIDLNSDLGEGASGENEVLELVTSANIACGFHAGDPGSVLASIRAAVLRGVAVGAHPSFADRQNFGRTEMQVSPAEVFALVTYQIGAFNALCRAAGTEMNHVKPHGALYNMAVRDRSLADAIAQAILAVDSRLILFAPAGSYLEIAAVELELQTASEVFADRNYMPDGSLVSRSRPDALLHDPREVADRVVRMLTEGKVRAIDGTEIPIVPDTVCVHGDTPGAVRFVRALRQRLEQENVRILAPIRRR
jgi:Uncharacterized proteins, homologs of lactam utilization protein B